MFLKCLLRKFVVLEPIMQNKRLNERSLYCTECYRQAKWKYLVIQNYCSLQHHNTKMYSWAHQNSGSELGPFHSQNCLINAVAQPVLNCVTKAPPPANNRRVPPLTTTADVWAMSPLTCTSTPALLMAEERRCVPRARHGDAGIRRRVKLPALPRTAKATTWSQKGKNTGRLLYLRGCLFHLLARSCARMCNSSGILQGGR